VQDVAAPDIDGFRIEIDVAPAKWAHLTTTETLNSPGRSRQPATMVTGSTTQRATEAPVAPSSSTDPWTRHPHLAGRPTF
jgi:hypothetical protein